MSIVRDFAKAFNRQDADALVPASSRKLP